MKRFFSILFIILFIPITIHADVIGDIDNDGRVGSSDYILLRKHLLKTATLPNNQLAKADVNGDGTISSLDYITIRKLVLGEKVTTPVTPTPVINVVDVKINKSSIMLISETTEKIIATINPSNAYNNRVTWSSSNSNIATVDNNGMVVAKATGSAIITVTTADGAKTASCVVNVITPKIFDQRNDAVIEYLKDPTASKVKSVYNSYKCGSNKCHQPKDYETSLTGSINIYRYETNKIDKKLIATVSSGDVRYYLIPGSTYYLEAVSDTSKVEVVTITGSLRMINGPVGNFRDLGGWAADGGTVKYGVLFRGGTTNGMKSLDGFNHLGIGGVVDLRPNSEIDSSSAVESIRKRISITYYTTGSNVRKAVEYVLKFIVEENKNVFFNCNFGRDRTGTIAYLLEGLLGVGLEDRKTDFELTYLYSNKRTRDDGSLKSLINKINNYNSTTYEQEKFINWYLSSSSDKNKDLELINNFRKKAINGNPHMYKLVDGKLTLA